MEPRGELVTEGQSPRSDWGEVAGEVADHAADVVSDAKRGARRMTDDASQGLRSAKERATAAYGRTAETAERAYREARGYAQQNPGTAAAVTFAAGIGVGMMLTPRGGGLHSSRRGLVPVVAIALAHAVLDVFDQAR